MHYAEARVATDRAERYLDQLCSHLGQMQHMRHRPASGHGATGIPRVEQVERAPGRAEVRFTDGTWTLRPEPGALLLRVRADDPAALERLEAAIAARIAKIGWRDGLTVEWHEAEFREEDGGAPEGARDGANGRGSGTRRRLRWIGWSAAIGAAAAVHLGLIGSLLGGGRWKDAAADAILLLLAVKLVLVALHAGFGRGRSRHG